MEILAEAFQQLASISAVLGGLSFTGAAAILNAGAASDDPAVLGRPAKVTAGTAMAGAVCFVAAAVMWTFMAADLNRAAFANASFPEHVENVNWIPSLGLLMGALLLLISIGVSGRIASRRLGRVTSVVATLGGLALFAIFTWFAEVG